MSSKSRRRDTSSTKQLALFETVPDFLNPVEVRTRKQADEMLRALKGLVSFDLETTCLYPWQRVNDKGENAPARIHRIGFGTKSTQYSVPCDDWDHDDLCWLVDEIDKRLPNCTVVAQNGKFDCLWMLVHFGVRWKIDFDTMLADYACDENRWHNIEAIAQRCHGAAKWDVPLKVKQGIKDSWPLTVYHCLDLYWTLACYKPLRKELDADTRVARVFDRILMPLSELFTEVEYDGVVVDITKFDAAEKALRENLAKAEANLKKHADIDWGSNKAIGNLLFNQLRIKPPLKTKKGAPSVSESALNMIDHPCVSDLIAFRGARQQLSFFIEGWRPFLHRKRVNGEWVYYLHPSFKLHGTVTGRPSCEHPNLQQVPRDKRIRTLITAEPGWVLVEVDLSQIELRIAAELANEKAMLYAFAHGIDIHWLTAIREIERGAAVPELVVDTATTWLIKCGKNPNQPPTYSRSIELLLEMGQDEAASINDEWKEYRKKAKAVNFGYLYGMWWKKFKMYARDNYGVEITDKQAEASRVAFFQMYPDLDPWHKRQKSFARRNGYVRSLSGRKRRLPAARIPFDSPARGQAERQAVNSPVQSFGAELNLMTALQLRKEYGRDVLRICGTIHDAILFRAREDRAVEIAKRALEIMSRPELLDEFNVHISVPILGEGKIGNWGEGIDIHKWEKAHVAKSSRQRTSVRMGR
ncbi:MAG: hypothetical protein E6R03_01035 [Hyphomicrobiaceae bacterium]|nr:MAG: hypothetical protein E6R03_01035 [Hyphomicrobiaceae bacterium]